MTNLYLAISLLWLIVGLFIMNPVIAVIILVGMAVVWWVFLKGVGGI